MDEHEPERRGLSYRRHQRGRAQGRARRLVHGVWGIPANPGNPWDHEPESVETLVRRLSVDRKVGRPNHSQGERPGERRAALNEKDQKEDPT